MSNLYKTSLLVLQLICLSSCSITFQYPLSPPVNNNLTSSVNIMPKTVTNLDNEKSSTETSTKVSENQDSKIVSNAYTPTLSSTKIILCSAFVPPVLPEVPRVDFTKLSAIPANNKEAINNLLVDNIQALNQHAKKVEELLRTATMNHKKTCTQKEVVNKK